MTRKTNSYSIKTKIQACIEYEENGCSLGSVGRSIGAHHTTISEWYLVYKEHGEEGFYNKKKESDFSEKQKKRIAKEYLDGVGSFATLAAKYNINAGMIRKWLEKWYNYEELNKNNSAGGKNAMEARKTSFEERVAIVKWVVDNNFNYKEAAKSFDLNYPLIYKWTKAYLEGGEKALDYKKRGPKIKKTIDESKLTDKERYDLELKKRDARISRLELEVLVLKKKAEMEEEEQSQRFNFLKNTK